MLLQSAGSRMVHPSSIPLDNTHTLSTERDNALSSAAVHPLLLLVLYVASACLCLMMASYLRSKRRSGSSQQSSPKLKDSTDEGKPKIILAEPGEWVRPLGNLETFMEIGGEYGSLNTAVVLWLSSKNPIDAEEVRRALLVVAERTHILQVRVEWRGLRPWFKRMNTVVLDFEVEDDDVMAALYTSLHRPYNMTKGPLWRARFVTIPQQPTEDSHRAALLLFANHCISDGHTSMTMSRDLLELLNASMTGRVYEVKQRPVISAMSDSLLSKRDWYYLFKYFWSKLYKSLITDYSSKTYFKGALVQPQTKVAVTKILRENFTVEQTKELIRHCKSAGVTVHSCIMATANLALLQTVKQRAKYRVEAALINTVNCINMRRYFAPELKDTAGCHISLEEKEMLIPCSAANSKEHFWSLVKIFHSNLNESLNVQYIPIRVTPLFRPSSILLHINYELTRRGRKNCTDNHMISTNMGNLKHLLPGKYDGPIEITDILRSVSSELTGNPFTVVFHTFMDKFMISLDYFTTKITDEAASQFFANLVTYIGNIARYGTVQEPVPALNGYLANGNHKKESQKDDVDYITERLNCTSHNGNLPNGSHSTKNQGVVNVGLETGQDSGQCNGHESVKKMSES